MTRPYLTDDDPQDKGYLDNDIPGLMKLFFIAITIWGLVFSLYHIFGGYDSEKRFDALRSGSSTYSATGR